MFYVGTGLTEDDVRDGINTIKAKLEHLCYGYRRFDSLYGERQNVNTSFIASGSTPENSLDDIELMNYGGNSPHRDDEQPVFVFLFRLQACLSTVTIMDNTIL